MPKFFVDKSLIDGDTVRIAGDDAHHISRSLRMAAGEHITVCDGEGHEYDCILTQFNPSDVVCRIVSANENLSEMPIKVRLFQGFPKGDKLDTVIQKSVECGVYSITPFESEYCIAKCKKENEDLRCVRRNRIAAEAAKQSGRGIIPTVNKTVSFAEMLKTAGQSQLALICYEGDTTVSIKDALRTFRTDRNELPNSISLIVGSEGGFSQEEIRIAKDAGVVPVGLGPRILRTETAPIFALSCIVYEYEL